MNKKYQKLLANNCANWEFYAPSTVFILRHSNKYIVSDFCVLNSLLVDLDTIVKSNPTDVNIDNLIDEKYFMIDHLGIIMYNDLITYVKTQLVYLKNKMRILSQEMEHHESDLPYHIFKFPRNFSYLNNYKSLLQQDLKDPNLVPDSVAHQDLLNELEYVQMLLDISDEEYKHLQQEYHNIVEINTKQLNDLKVSYYELSDYLNHYINQDKTSKVYFYKYYLYAPFHIRSKLSFNQFEPKYELWLKHKSQLYLSKKDYEFIVKNFAYEIKEFNQVSSNKGVSNLFTKKGFLESLKK